MSRQQIIERERRLRPWVVACSILPLVLYMAALVLESGSGLEIGGLETERLRSVDAHPTALLLATIARSLGFLVMVVPLVYLFRAAQARSERVQGLFLGLIVLGPVLLAIQGMVTWVAETDVASQYVEQSPGVGDIYTLANNLNDESGGLQTAAAMVLPGMLGLIFAMIYTPLWAVRTGLLTRFFGTLGMALGASILFILQIALLGVLFWLLYFGLVILGRVPAGRPPAWDAGEAIPWPVAGEEPVAAAAGPDADVVEGDASEIPGVGESQHSARRERARKRKRKRRS